MIVKVANSNKRLKVKRKRNPASLTKGEVKTYKQPKMYAPRGNHTII